MIDPRLHVLRVLAERGTVTAAATALQYTPSAVSHQLRTLARDLGVTLLEPDGRGLRLTTAGQVLLERVDGLFAHWEEINADLARSATGHAGTVGLCGFSTAAAALLPYAAARVRAAHPLAVVRIIEADPVECFDLLLTGGADVAVVVSIPSLPPMHDPRFDQAPLLEDPLDLLVSDDHPLAARPSVSLADAAAEPWILDRPGRPYRQLVQAACATAGFSPAIAHEAAEWETGAALVDAGLGVALVPRLAHLPSGYRITRVPLHGDPSPVRQVLSGIRGGSGRQPVVATALEALAEATTLTADRRYPV